MYTDPYTGKPDFGGITQDAIANFLMMMMAKKMGGGQPGQPGQQSQQSIGQAIIPREMGGGPMGRPAVGAPNMGGMQVPGGQMSPMAPQYPGGNQGQIPPELVAMIQKNPQLMMMLQKMMAGGGGMGGGMMG